MSTPIATSDDLATFLGQTVDDDRATMLLTIAQSYCEDEVTPLPASAFGIVLAVAARAYSNPQQNANITTGPYAFAPAQSIYLLRSERAALRRAAGRGGGGVTSSLPQGVNAVQTVTVTATAGTYTLTFGGQTTAPLAFNASPATVQAALQALSNIGAGNVTVAAGLVVTFVNDLGNYPQPQLVADGSSLTGTVAVAVTAVGVAAPGSNLPYWDYDYSPGRW